MHDVKWPTGEVPLRGTFAPFFTHSIDYLAEIGIASFTFKILVFHLGRKRNTNKENKEMKTTTTTETKQKNKDKIKSSNY